jgi:hypothetical protein
MKPSVPSPQPLAGAIERNDSLTGLGRRLAESNARFAAIRDVLPPALAEQLQAGPIDDEGWSVLASNAAVAAKLRHWLPRLTQELHSRSFRALPIRVRLRSARASTR